MAQRVLITGGAGFIGLHLTRQLLNHGYKVRVLDNLARQVHENNTGEPVEDHPWLRWPAGMRSEVEAVCGDVRDASAVRNALKGCDKVIHFAAKVGVGQSMYQIRRYASVNDLGTATLLEELTERPVGRLLVASSMSVYGEGLYEDEAGRLHEQINRPLPQLQARAWEPHGDDGGAIRPVSTPEWKRPQLSSVYAISKFNQEKMCLAVGGAYGIPTAALRFFNVYGPGQALSNPYTGVLAIFASRLLNDRPPLIFEDGRQRRDFVHVADIANACRLALERPEVDGEALNIGSGVSRSVREIAESLMSALGNGHLEPQVTESYRVGDVRHCFADIRRAAQQLGYQPTVDLEEGLAELKAHLLTQTAADHVEAARGELQARGLTV